MTQSTGSHCTISILGETCMFRRQAQTIFLLHMKLCLIHYFPCFPFHRFQSMHYISCLLFNTLYVIHFVIFYLIQFYIRYLYKSYSLMSCIPFLCFSFFLCIFCISHKIISMHKMIMHILNSV